MRFTLVHLMRAVPRLCGTLLPDPDLCKLTCLLPAGFDQGSRAVQDALMEQAGEEQVAGCIALCLEVGAGPLEGGRCGQQGQACGFCFSPCPWLGSEQSSQYSAAAVPTAQPIQPTVCAGRPGKHRPHCVRRLEKLPSLLPSGAPALGASPG